MYVHKEIQSNDKKCYYLHILKICKLNEINIQRLKKYNIEMNSLSIRIRLREFEQYIIIIHFHSFVFIVVIRKYILLVCKNEMTLIYRMMVVSFIQRLFMLCLSVAALNSKTFHFINGIGSETIQYGVGHGQRSVKYQPQIARWSNQRRQLISQSK